MTGPPRASQRVTAATGCECGVEHMIRWLLVTFLALVLFSGLQPWLQKLGFGRLPGDLHFRLFGREWSIPITSTLLLSMLAAGIARWL